MLGLNNAQLTGIKKSAILGRMMQDDFPCIAVCRLSGLTNKVIIKGYNLFKIIPDLIKSVDGIFFQTDVQAFGFLNAARDNDLSIPKDLKIIGYDDTPVCEYTSPRLSTIHQPQKELANLAANRIMDLINNKNVEIFTQEIILPTLVLRESC